MDIITSAVPGPSPTSPPQQVFVTVNGYAGELEALMLGIQRALSGGPQVVEARAMNNVPIRILIDRLGPPTAQGG